ncbi:MAG: response regulator [Solirubrobacterales bacterium]
MLIVEDDVADAEHLAKLMRDVGAAVIVAESGERAMQFVGGHFDLALVNLSLPGMSGIEFIMHFRKIHPGTPVAIVTGYDPGCLQQLGVAYVFAKPFLAKHRDMMLADFNLILPDYEANLEGHCGITEGSAGRARAVA